MSDKLQFVERYKRDSVIREAEHNDKLKEALIKFLRRVASSEFRPAFQSREELVKCLRRVATPETNEDSIVVTRRECGRAIPALKRWSKFRRRYASKKLNQSFLKFIGH